jgi:1,4-dihydroxy-2-naphthoate octaprenyltransferase
VLVGTAAAARGVEIDPTVFAVTLATAVLLQVAANLANDYFDFQKGVDTNRRLGPLRVTQLGLLAPEAVRRGLVVVLAAGAAAGVYLGIKGGWPILLIGVTALIGAVAYSAGPLPLSWHGLGDPLAFGFFGLVAVYGTIHLQEASFDAVSLLSALAVGCLVTTIIVVNNLRDIPTDRDCGKRTLAVRIGPRATRWEYSALVACAYLLVAASAALGSLAQLLPLLSLPMGIGQITAIWRAEGAALNANLLGTVRLHLVFGLLLAVGLCS